MNKINILYLVSTLKKSGPLNILFGIASGLDKERFNILIVSLSQEKSDSMYTDFEPISSEIVQLKNSRLKGVFKNREKVASLVRDRKIDLVHSHGLRADIINNSLTDVARMTTIHNFPDEDYTMKYGKVKGRIMSLKHRKAISKIETRISCSNYIKEKFSKEYGIESDCIQNGVDLKVFSNKSIVSKENLRKHLSLPIEKKIFLVSGSLIKRKEPDTILKAFHLLHDTNIMLVFIGSGNMELELRRNSTDSRVKFMGVIENVQDYLMVSDYFVSASSSEGLPNSVLEALAADLPLILSDIPPHAEIVGKSYPLLFKPHDPLDLSQKMKFLLSDPYSRSFLRNKEQLLQKFDSDRMADQYQTKYLEQCQLTEI